jgi:hypothetical protein
MWKSGASAPRERCLFERTRRVEHEREGHDFESCRESYFALAGFSR